jgi:hypothetical protein
MVPAAVIRHPDDQGGKKKIDDYRRQGKEQIEPGVPPPAAAKTDKRKNAL